MVYRTTHKELVNFISDLSHGEAIKIEFRQDEDFNDYYLVTPLTPEAEQWAQRFASCDFTDFKPE